MRRIPAFFELRLPQQTTLGMYVLAALLPTVLASSKPCSSNEISVGGKHCCDTCPPGSGVIAGCNSTSNTQCESCVETDSYSPNSSYDLPCLPCTKCQNNSHVVTPCNTTSDTVCQCDQNFYWNPQANRCTQCDLCRPGHGARQACTPLQNTRCDRCGDGMFSAQHAVGPCLPCTVCGEEQLLLQRCRRTEDTVCMDISAHRPTILPLFPKTVSTLAHNTTEAGKSDILPVYCALLAGLVVGLVTYVIVLQIRRNRARHAKKSLSAAISGGTREGARLAQGASTPQIPPTTQGSDSGVFVDNSDVKTVSLSPSFRVRDLPPPLKRALETAVHTAPDNRGGWRTLARQLGYNSPRASAFHTRAIRDNILPARYLLSDWCKKSHATVGALQVALHKIGRADITMMFHMDQIPHHPSHRRSRESINGALGRSNSMNQDHRSKSVGLNNLEERNPEGAAEVPPVSPHRNQRRSMAISLSGSQRLIDV